MLFKTLLALSALAVVHAEPGQTLTVAASGGHDSSPLLFGALYEDLYHSGDGGLYAELIRNRAFQGGTENNSPTLKRSTQFWHTVGNCQLSVETTKPYLSTSLPWSMKLTVPAGTKGKVGFYNDGFFGMHVDQAKRYAGSFNIRGAYTGTVVMGFRNTLTTKGLSNQTVSVKSTAGAWTNIEIPVFQPSASSSVADNTFEFLFDGAALAGKTVNFNLFSLFKQTYKDRYNGVREDLANVYDGLGSTWVRLPGGNNMQGFSDGEEFRFNETIGDLKNRPGHRGTWTDIDTSGFGMLEQMQWAVDAKQQVFLGIFAGLHIGGAVVPKEKLQPYVQLALNQIEFLIGDRTTTWGKVRANLGYPQPFDIKHVEIGNEDFFGEPSYSDYRWDAFYKPIRAKYPNLILISTVSPAPNGLGVKDGVWADEHIYENEDNMAKLYSRYDNHDRSKPVIVGEYATVVRGSNPGQEGYQTMGMTMSEAIMMLGGERNSDIVKGIAHGALIKAYVEEPGTVALIKHTAGPDIVKSNTYYLSQLFSQYHGNVTLPVSTAGGLGLGPVYWSATKSSGGSTYLKLVNYHGPGSAVYVAFQGAHSATAQVITFTAPDCGSINNIPSAGGETSTITKTTIKEQNGKFAVYFGGECEIKILVV